MRSFFALSKVPPRFIASEASVVHVKYILHANYILHIEVVKYREMTRKQPIMTCRLTQVRIRP